MAQTTYPQYTTFHTPSRIKDILNNLSQFRVYETLIAKDYCQFRWWSHGQDHVLIVKPYSAPEYSVGGVANTTGKFQTLRVLL